MYKNWTALQTDTRTDAGNTPASKRPAGEKVMIVDSMVWSLKNLV